MRQRLESWADYFGGIGFALVIAGIIFYVLKKPIEQAIPLAALGIVLIALYVWARPQQVRETLGSRGARYGSNALITTLAFFGLIVVLNWLASNATMLPNSGRYDLTANKSNSLSDLTIKVLQDLKEPVKATAFYVTQRSDQQTLTDVQDKLKQYARLSDKFTFRVVDPQIDPLIANDYNVQYEMIVLERGAKRENVLSTDEQALTNAIQKLSQDREQVVYFVTGHGEHGIEDSGDNGYSGIKSRLEAFNFKSNTLNLRTMTDTLPVNMVAMIIAGPRQKLDADEVQRVKDYLEKNNGHVLVLADPQTETGLEPLLKSWGVNLRNDALLDLLASQQGRPQTLVVSAYKSHKITQSVTNFYTVFPGSTRSIFADSPLPGGRSASPLFSTSANSWGETNFDSLRAQNPAFDVNTDTRGPLDFGYAIESGGQGARLVVIGNSAFVSNNAMRSFQGIANDILFADTLKWLGGQEDLIAIPPKPQTSFPLVLDAEKTILIIVSSICLLPGIILLIGGIVWWRRR